MQEPQRQAPHLEALPHQDQDSTEAEAPEDMRASGGGGPPGNSLMKDGGLWTVCGFGVILFCLSLIALSKETITGTEHWGPHPFPLAVSFADIRIYGEYLILIVGSACMFTSLACIRAKCAARKLETVQKVRTVQAKRLERISDQSIFGTIAQYIGAMLDKI